MDTISRGCQLIAHYGKVYPNSFASLGHPASSQNVSELGCFARSDAPDSSIASLLQKIRDVEADIKKAQSKAEKAEAEGDLEGLRFLRVKEEQLREEEEQLREEKARKEALQQGKASCADPIPADGCACQAILARSRSERSPLQHMVSCIKQYYFCRLVTAELAYKPVIGAEKIIF